MKNQIFEYGGFHFIPERQLTAEEDFWEISHRQRIDQGLGFCIPGYIYESRYPYSHEAFYEAASDKDCDLFRCIENGKLYLPCENDLQEYIENKRRKNECMECDCYDPDEGCALESELKIEYCPKCSGYSEICGLYREFYDDITALHDCDDCGIKSKCKFAPEPGQMVRINCPLWVEK
ncbi:hypothetical protein [Anaeromassilibacillus sp. SJQ-5]